MLLRDWMREEGFDDAKLADEIGNYSAASVRSLRSRRRGPSPRVAAKVFEITKGKVGPSDTIPVIKVKAVPAGEPAHA